MRLVNGRYSCGPFCRMMIHAAIAGDHELAAAAASRPGDARGARLPHLVVIVEEPDRAEAQRHEQARPDERVATGPSTAGSTALIAVRIISPPIVGVPRLARCVCGPSARIGWPLPWRTRSQPMNFGPMISPISSAVATAAPVRKRLVADQVEQPGKAQLLGDPDTASTLPLERRDDARQPHPVRSLDQHRVARRAASSRSAVERRRGVGHMDEVDRSLKRCGERRHRFADQHGAVRRARRRSARPAPA